MDDQLLDAAQLFQTLFTRDLPNASVAFDLDVDSFEHIPFVTHTSLIAQDGNGEGLWTVTLIVNLFVAPHDAQAFAASVYRVIRRWAADPEKTYIEGVGSLDLIEDANAFVPVSGTVTMLNKVVRQYQGSFNMRARVH